MSFLAWTFLFGAAAVVGPIVAHMLAKPRFRRVPFTMVQLLRAGRHESHSRRKIRDLLVLLLRCAIIVLIAVLFAQPVLRVKAPPSQRKSIYCLGLDDSASMAYEEGGSSLFERMVERAVDAVREAPDDAVFTIYGLASGALAEGLSRNQVLAEIKRLAVTPRRAHAADFVQVLRQASQAVSPGDAISAVVLSDLTPEVLRDFERVQEPAAIASLSYEIIAPTESVNNAAVVEARAIDAANNRLDVDVVVANHGDVAQRRKLTMNSRDRLPVSTDVALAAGQSRVVRMQMDLGPAAQGAVEGCLPMELSLEPGDGLAADDVHRVGICIPPAASAKVLVVHQGDEAFLFETAIQALAGQGPSGTLALRKVTADRLAAEDLAWANVVVFSSLPTDFTCPVAPLKTLLARGGRLVFFATRLGNLQVAELLLREGLLAALPQKWVQGTTYPEPLPVAGGGVSLGEEVTKALSNYRFDKIALKGHWQCRVPTESECPWRLSDGPGFLYSRSSKAGSTILVNTSIDSSLGLLPKSGAWVAFCRFLLGESDRIRQFCFGVEERPVLTLPEAMQTKARTVVPVLACDGSRTQAVVDGTRMVLPRPQTTGWMKTLGEQVVHAGVNLDPGETDLARPAAQAIADAMTRVFVTGADPAQMPARAGPAMQSKPLWKAFAWAAVLLLLLEPAITNRLRR
ncbi:MAG: BatA domain-containing protein [Phycisphaerae bacterium]|nr:BatA domain-containing protein [Phycisphaerae bacterium]